MAFWNKLQIVVVKQDINKQADLWFNQVCENVPQTAGEQMKRYPKPPVTAVDLDIDDGQTKQDAKK